MKELFLQTTPAFISATQSVEQDTEARSCPISLCLTCYVGTSCDTSYEISARNVSLYLRSFSEGIQWGEKAEEQAECTEEWWRNWRNYGPFLGHGTAWVFHNGGLPNLESQRMLLLLSSRPICEIRIKTERRISCDDAYISYANTISNLNKSCGIFQNVPLGFNDASRVRAAIGYGFNNSLVLS